MISSFETRKRSEVDSEKTSPGSNPVAFVPSEQIEILLFAHAIYIARSAISIRSPLFFYSKFGHEHQTRIEACRAIAIALENTKLTDAFTAYINEINQFGWVAAIARDPKSLGYRLAPNWKTYLRLRRHARKGRYVRIF